MGASLRVGSRTFEVGTSRFMNCFFSTVAVRLEGGQRASRFPKLLGEFYGGSIAPHSVTEALEELAQIREALAFHPPGDVICDVDDRSSQPPWGTAIAPGITSLANYFWTSDGRPLLDVLQMALVAALERREPVTIE